MPNKLVPPAWIQRPPEKKDVIAGTLLELPCNAKGSPKPKIYWKKEIGIGHKLVSSGIIIVMLKLDICEISL